MVAEVTRMPDLVARLAGTLIVSCQAYPGEPLRHPGTMARMAEAVVAGGAAAVRVQGLADIAAVRGRVDVPVVGLWKDGPGPVSITPTLRHARAVLHAGADVVALDGTRRSRPDGLGLAATIRHLREAGDHGGAVVMADCGSVDDALAARDAGADLLGTTLAGYTGERPRTEGPDLDVLARIVDRVPELPVVAEGRIHTPDQARACLRAGAHAVVVGTAITHLTTTTSWFRDALADGPAVGG